MTSRTKEFHRQRAKHWKKVAKEKRKHGKYISDTPTDKEVWDQLENERPKWYKRKDNPHVDDPITTIIKHINKEL